MVKMIGDLHASTGNRRQMLSVKFLRTSLQWKGKYKLQVTKWGKISMENKTDIKTHKTSI